MSYVKHINSSRISSMSGDSQGFMKIVARVEDKKSTIIGVHIVGEGANELIQLGYGYQLVGPLPHYVDINNCIYMYIYFININICMYL
jgi:hypothetical protein